MRTLSRRRPPRKHKVHPKDKRYRVGIYERGQGLYARVVGESGSTDLPLDDPKKAEESVAQLKANFSDKSPDEQLRIVKAVAYARQRCETYANSGLADESADRVDNILKTRRVYSTAHGELDASFYRQKYREEHERELIDV